MSRVSGLYQLRRGGAADPTIVASEARRAHRAAVFRGAVLAMLSQRDMSAVDVGRALYGRGAVATGKATGGLLALRRDGLVGTRIEYPRAKWWITDSGKAWLDDALAIREEE